MSDVGSARRRPIDALSQAGLIAAMLLAYLGMRVVVEGSADSAVANGEGLLSFEAALGLDLERGAQDLVPATSELMEFFNFVYLWAYWPLLFAALALLWWRDSRAYSVFRNTLFIAGGIGLVIFALYPVAPPRFLAGFTDTVGEGRDSALTNKYAAMPSFHVGWLVVAAVTLVETTKSTVARWALFVPPALMAAAVVFTANHYLLDGLVGIAVSVVALCAARRWQARGGLLFG